MFRIRKVYDDVSPANRHTLAQVANIMHSQFPLASHEEIDKLPGQLRDALKFGFRSVVFVAEDARDRVKGFALFLNEGHDIHHGHDRGYLEAPVRIRAILKELDKTGLFERMQARRTTERLLKTVHDPEYVQYLKRAFFAGLCARWREARLAAKRRQR